MSIAHLKKQAKNLVRLLPVHINTNPAGGSLAACQELIARASGYPSFHAATSDAAHERADILPLSRRIFDDLREVHHQTFSDEANLWHWRTESLISAVLNLQLFLEARGETLEIESLYDIHVLESAVEKWRFAPGSGTHSMENYLKNLPAYVAPSSRGQGPIEEATVIHHGYHSMAIKSLRKAQPSAQPKPLAIMHHDEGSLN